MNFKPIQQNECISATKKIASMPKGLIQKTFQEKREKLLDIKISVSSWLANFIELNF